MTGFGRATGHWQSFRVTIEVSSLNGKNLDVACHTPAALPGFDIELRRRVARKLSRGKVRVFVRVDEEGEAGGGIMRLRDSYVREYLRLFEELKASYGLEGSVKAEELLFAPSVISTGEEDLTGEEFARWASDLALQAIDRLRGMRQEEGSALRTDLEARLTSMATHLDAIREMAPRVKECHRRRLTERLAEWDVPSSIPEERLDQEVLLLCERSDINEEMVRLDSHLSQFRAALEEGGAVGRRLEFLAQEMHREITTIGSKASEAEISSRVVLFKEELASAREQIQNVE